MFCLKSLNDLLVCSISTNLSRLVVVTCMQGLLCRDDFGKTCFSMPFIKILWSNRLKKDYSNWGGWFIPLPIRMVSTICLVQPHFFKTWFLVHEYNNFVQAGIWLHGLNDSNWTVKRLWNKYQLLVLLAHFELIIFLALASLSLVFDCVEQINFESSRTN